MALATIQLQKTAPESEAHSCSQPHSAPGEPASDPEDTRTDKSKGSGTLSSPSDL